MCVSVEVILGTMPVGYVCLCVKVMLILSWGEMNECGCGHGLNLIWV